VIYGDYMPTFTPDPDKVWEINNREDKGRSPKKDCADNSGRGPLQSQRRDSY
jgi:hypothetical protein